MLQNNEVVATANGATDWNIAWFMFSSPHLHCKHPEYKISCLDLLFWSVSASSTGVKNKQ